MFKESLFSAPSQEKTAVNAHEISAYQQKTEVDEMDMREKLDEIEPGCSSYLRTNCNISHMARYPEAVLLDMYRRRDDRMPWGLMIVAKADHNGASYHQQATNSMHEQIGQSFQTRIIEAESPAEAIAFAEKMQQKFGRASYCMIAAHGHENGFSLGESSLATSEDETSMSTEHANDSSEGPLAGNPENSVSMSAFGEMLKRLLKENAGVCFMSCSTGKNDDSIGAQMATYADRPTVAPTEDTNIESWGATIKGDLVHFKPKYYNGQARETGAGEGVVSNNTVSDTARTTELLAA